MQSSSPDREGPLHNQPTQQQPHRSMPSLIKSTSPPQSLSLNTSLPSTDPSYPEIDRPPISPITPTSEEPHPQPHANATATASSNNSSPQQEEQQKHPLPLSSNPDAIALRTAISLLQLQRAQTTTDIQSLDHLKTAALADPEGFLTDLKSNELSSTNSPRTSKFPPIPRAQSIVRTPPIEWSKYHIVGPSLDKLHQQQTLYPGITDAQIHQSGGQHPPKHEIATPYRPGVDRLEEKKGGR